jgi:hypothetical protein
MVTSVCGRGGVRRSTLLRLESLTVAPSLDAANLNLNKSLHQNALFEN